MKKLLFLAFLVPFFCVSMDRNNAYDTYNKLKEEATAIKNKAELFDYITNPWIPTSMFITSLTYEGIKSFRNNSLPTFSGIYEEVKDAPRFLMVSSVILLGCMVYSYYKPMVSSFIVSFHKDSAYDQKKKS